MRDMLQSRGLAARVLVLALILTFAMGGGLLAQAADPGDVVINEIMQNPAAVSDAAGEWFELYNPTAGGIDINGWTIQDNGVDSHLIDNGGPLVIPAGSYLVLGNNADFATNGGVAVDYEYAGDWFLSNSADEVVLLDDGLTEIDRVEYDGGPIFPDPTGASMALRDPTLDNSIGANWCTSPTPYGDGDLGTPGAANDCPDIPDFGVCGDPATFIHDVQGTGDASPLVGTAGVIIEGVVVGDFQGTAQLDGFFVQEEDADADADPLTSEGVFVFNPGGLDVNVGDVVRVQGDVTEFFDLTELNNVINLAICAPGLTPAATPVDLPVLSDTFLEQFEGMLVTFPETLYATDHYDLHRFGEVVLSADGRQFNPTDFMPPGPGAADSDGDSVADINEPGRLLLDDGSNIQFPATVPYVAADGTLRLGDSVTGLTGALSYGFGSYRLEPTGPVAFNRDNPRLPLDDVGGVIKVASFNLLNYWTTFDDGVNDARGADSAVEFQRQKDKTVAAILALDADVVALQELENNGDVAIGDLVDALNAATAPGTWAFVPEPPGVAGTNAIKVGLIYQTARVSPVGDSVADTDPIHDRPPVAQTFDASQEIFTVVANHFKSKGCSDAIGPDLDQGDGQACYNAKRTAQAAALINFVADLQTASGDGDVLAMGDFNSYALEDPIRTLEGGLANQMPDDYSYVFFGQAGLLDYIFTSNYLADPVRDRVKGVDVWHINADEPRVLDYNDQVIDAGESSSHFSHDYLYVADQYRSSDHDPVLVGFCDEIPPEIDIVLTPDELWAPNHKFEEVTADVSAVDNFDPNPVIEFVSIESNEPVNDRGDGNTEPDIEIIDDYTFNLRAERSGLGEGRRYTLTYRATDSCGNVAEASAAVTVAHDQGQDKDEGQVPPGQDKDKGEDHDQGQGNDEDWVPPGQDQDQEEGEDHDQGQGNDEDWVPPGQDKDKDNNGKGPQK